MPTETICGGKADLQVQMPFSKRTSGVTVVLLLLIFTGLFSTHHCFQRDGTKQTRL